MNRAQKNAWFGLSFSLIASILILFIFAIFSHLQIQTFPWIFGVSGAAALAFIVLLLCSFIFRKRQNGDIEADERDRSITNKAIKISFISVWPFLILANTLTIYFTGIVKSVPAILFVFIHVGVFVFSAITYFLSILIIYQAQGDDKNIEGSVV